MVKRQRMRGLILNGARIREARLAHGWNQEDFEDETKVGPAFVVTRHTLSRAERCLAIDKRSAERICGALALDLVSIHMPARTMRQQKSPAASRSQHHGLSEFIERSYVPAIVAVAQQGNLNASIDLAYEASRSAGESDRRPLENVIACLSRIAGRKGVARLLLDLADAGSPNFDRALLEFLLAQFAYGAKLDDCLPTFATPEYLGHFDVQLRKCAYGLLGLWHLHEARQSQAAAFFESARLEPVVDLTYAHYMAIPFGLLCFGLGRGELGEQYWELARAGPASARYTTEGYPYVTLVGDLDKKFVAACIGRSTGRTDVDEGKLERPLRFLRGQAWLLARYADVLLHHQLAMDTFAARGRTWSPPLDRLSISDRLRAFQRSLLDSISGVRPMI
jgi:transcriptional regulator with XRE-family HTH domain